MTEFAIQAKNLGKQFRIGAVHTQYNTLRDSISNAFAGVSRRAGRLLGRGTNHNEAQEEIIWALKDVSFDVNRGEIVGVIGRNGAGKSTLLKILSRITEPTSGYAEVRGRVGSLLEVGTGFHPELTGRENVFLNGAILGMKRSEIASKFDGIVEFSEISKFIDTPVKRYSSGMYLRLAFAVAAHLEPDILMVDEVLAVGDAKFQQKCMTKMEDVRQEGRTVLFVSHNLNAVTRLCKRAILLDEGKLVMDATASKAVSTYLNAGVQITAMREWKDLESAPGDDAVRLRGARSRNEQGQIIDTVNITDPVWVDIEYDVLKPNQVLFAGSDIMNESRTLVFSTYDMDLEWRNKPRPVGRYVSSFQIPGNLLSEGRLFIHVAVWTLTPSMRDYFYEKDVVSFNVIETSCGNSARGDYMGEMFGPVRPLLTWKTVLSR